MSYRIHFKLKNVAPDCTFMSSNGPFDYRYNAIAERNKLFHKDENIQSCWVTKDFNPTGKVLNRL